MSESIFTQIFQRNQPVEVYSVDGVDGMLRGYYSPGLRFNMWPRGVRGWGFSPSMPQMM